MTIHPARPPMSYEQIIDKGAQDIERVLRTGRPAHVYVWPTLQGSHPSHESPPARGPGVIIATSGDDVPKDPYGPRRDFPIYIRPLSYRDWSCVPFGAIRDQLWHMCRHVPLMTWGDPS